MNGKELIYKKFNGEDIAAVPWVPFAGVHAGKLKGYTAKEVLKDGDKLLESLLEVNKIYRPDGQPIMFDLQLEAEVLGCELKWAPDSPPTVSKHPLAESEFIPSIIPSASAGRIPMVLDVIEKMKKAVGGKTALFGLVCGPFTLASHLRGVNLFMDMVVKPEYVKRLLDYTAQVALAMAGYYLEKRIDVIAVVDPMVSQISPLHFKEFLRKPFSNIFDFVQEKGAFSSFFVCGNALYNIEEMCATKPDSIFIDENVPMDQAKAITDRYSIILGGNIPLTTIMLFGTQQDNMKYALDLLDTLNNKNLIIAPGCDMPYHLPIDNTIAVEQAVHYPEKVRKMVVDYEKEEDGIEVELPDYNRLEKPLLEVFTLDSDTCAACTYMHAAALDVQKHFLDQIDVVEYKYTNRENIARIKKIGVKNLPSIYLNGELKYASLVPNRAELIKEVERWL